MSTYKSYRSNAFSQTGKQMKKFLSNDIYEQNLDDKELCYSLVEKEGEKKMTFNERLLVLHSHGWIGYCSKLESSAIIPFTSESKLPLVKAKIPLEDIKTHELKANVLSITFREITQKEKTWTFKFSTHNLGFQWENRIMEAIDKVKTQKLKPPEIKQSDSPQIQPALSPRKSFMKIENIFNQQIISSIIHKQPQKNGSQDLETSKPGFASADVSIVNSSRQHKNEQQSEESLFLGDKSLKEKSIHIPTTKSAIVSIDPILQRSLSSLNEQNINRTQTNSQMTFSKEIAKKLSCQWSYEFLQSEEAELFPLFTQFSEGLAQKLIDELVLPVNLQTYKPRIKESNMYEYAFQHVTARLGFIIQGENEIYNQDAVRRLKNQFHNMAYLLKHIGNEGKLRVPLSALVEYKGITALVIATPVIKGISKVVPEIVQDLKILSLKTHIKPEVFEDQHSMVICAADIQYYNRLARKNSDSTIKQQLYFFTDVKHFLPEDTFLNVSKSSLHQLMPQFLENSPINEMFEGRPLKGQQHSDYSNRLIALVDEVAKQWEQNMEDVVLPKDITKLLHEKGLSSNYLGLLYQSTQIKPIKRIIMSEIVAKSLQIIVRGRLCSQILTQNISLFSKQINPVQEIRRKNEQLVQGLMDIRRLLSESYSDMEALWEQIDRTSIIHFNKSIDVTDLMDSYLILSVLQHSKLKVHWRQFELNRHMRDELFKGLRIKTKTYSLSFTDNAKELEQLLQKPDNFEKIVNILEIQKQTPAIPDWVRQTNLYHKLRMYLAENGVILERKDSDGEYLKSSDDLKYELFKLKYYIKQQRTQEANKTKQLILRQISKVYGQSHPFCWFVQDIQTQELERKNRFEQALISAKGSQLKMIKFLDSNHPKLKTINLKIATILRKLGRKTESIDFYKKAKELQKSKHQILDINIKLGELQLELKRKLQAQVILRQCLKEIERSKPLLQEQLTNVLKLLFSCISDDKPKTKELISFCEAIALKIQEPQYLQQLFKIIIPYEFEQIPSNQTQLFGELVEHLDNIEQGKFNYAYSSNIIKQRLRKDVMFSNLRQYLSELPKLLRYIQINKTVDDWEGFMSVPKNIFEDFLTIISVLIFFLSKQFILGSLPKG